MKLYFIEIVKISQYWKVPNAESLLQWSLSDWLFCFLLLGISAWTSHFTTIFIPKIWCSQYFKLCILKWKLFVCLVRNLRQLRLHSYCLVSLTKRLLISKQSKKCGSKFVWCGCILGLRDLKFALNFCLLREVPVWQ